MMNKFKKISFVGLMALSALCGCAKNNNNNNNNDNPSSQTDDDSSSDLGYTLGSIETRDVNLPTEIPLLMEDSVQIHYHRDDNIYSAWELWLWDKNADGATYGFNYQDEFGLVASYPLSTFGSSVYADSLGFIIKKPEWAAKDVDSDLYIEFTNLTKDENGVYHVYILSGNKTIYIDKNLKQADTINYCKWQYNKGTNPYFSITVSSPLFLSHATFYKDGVAIYDTDVTKKYATLKLDSGEIPDLQSTYEVEVTFKDSGKKKTFIPDLNEFYNLDSFNDNYYYDGDLGALYSSESTTFRVWSPSSKKIVLKVYNSGTPTAVSTEKGDDTVINEVEMVLGEKGTWETTINEDLGGKYYTYTVYSATYPNGKEIVDPYAKSCGVNGQRGMIVDFSKTNPDGWDDVKVNDYSNLALTVYETHVADVTSSSTWGGTADNSKKFLGLCETGTTLPTDSTIATGFDHIKDLGVNAVQLLPVFDQANDETDVSFNWGYNPENYNCVEGAYSSDPYDGYARIKELKEVSKAYNNAHINLIMDVVYNHVNGVTGSNFDVLMPGYYFRYTNGTLTNGSGCGNETASEHKMYQKFMIDSTEFWASEYKFGGFRFDLMGLHDVSTMNKISENLKTNVNENITVYGEPWTGGTSGLASNLYPATQSNANSLVGVGQFNDQMRDALIKGGMSGVKEKGWVTSTETPGSLDVAKIVNGLQGITYGATLIKDPNKTVNYVTCHDNYTLYDRIAAADITDEDEIRQMAMLANAVVLTSQGTTFMLAGEEMLRTKQGNSNSYNASYEVNELDYSKLTDTNIAKMYKNYKDLVSFKTTCAALQLNSNSVITENMSVESLDNGSMIKYTINYGGAEVLVFHTNGYDTTHTNVDLTGYSIMADTVTGLTGNGNGVITPTKYQTVVAFKI